MSSIVSAQRSDEYPPAPNGRDVSRPRCSRGWMRASRTSVRSVGPWPAIRVEGRSKMVPFSKSTESVRRPVKDVEKCTRAALRAAVGLSCRRRKCLRDGRVRGVCGASAEYVTQVKAVAISSRNSVVPGQDSKERRSSPQKNRIRGIDDGRRCIKSMPERERSRNRGMFSMAKAAEKNVSFGCGIRSSEPTRELW